MKNQNYNKLIRLLSEKEQTNLVISYTDLSKTIKCSHRTIRRLIQKFKKDNLLSLTFAPNDYRLRLISLNKEKTMSRLRRIPFDREEIKASLKKTSNTFFKKYGRQKRAQAEFIQIPQFVLDVINHWNSKKGLPKMVLPERQPNSIYHNPTKVLIDTVKTIKEIIAGNFFGSAKIGFVFERYEKAYTQEEIIQTIDNYYISMTDKKYAPSDKIYLATNKRNLITFLYTKYARSNMFKSLFLHYYNNPPREITERGFIDLTEPYLTQYDKDFNHWGDYWEEFQKTCKSWLKIEDKNDEKLMEIAAIKLFNHAQLHGGIFPPHKVGCPWINWSFDAMKELGEKRPRYGPSLSTLSKNWFYYDVLPYYLLGKQEDWYVDEHDPDTIFWDQEHQEKEKRPTKNLTKEEWMKLYPNMDPRQVDLYFLSEGEEPEDISHYIPDGAFD